MIDLEALRNDIANLLERHFRPLFRPEMRLNFLALHPSNPNAHILTGQSSPNDIRNALDALQGRSSGDAPLAVLLDEIERIEAVSEEQAERIAKLMPLLTKHACFVEAMPKTTLYLTPSGHPQPVNGGNGGASQAWMPVSTDNTRGDE